MHTTKDDRRWTRALLGGAEARALAASMRQCSNLPQSSPKKEDSGNAEAADDQPTKRRKAED